MSRKTFRLGFSPADGGRMVSRNHLFHANDQAMDGEGQGVRNLSFLLVLISVFAGLGGSAALISVL